MTVYALYWAGTVPFMLALFSFSAEMSYGRNAGENCAGSAFVVALTYCWMKGLQAFSCRELVRVYTGEVNRWWRPATMLAIWSRQIAFHPLGFFIKPLAWLLVFPVTYVSAFFQNLTVLGGAQRNHVRKSWELARLWPKQSYAMYGLLSLLALIVFVDLYALIFSIPFVLNIILGIESFLTRSYTWVFSPVLLIADGNRHLFLARSPGQSDRGNPLLQRRVPENRCGFASPTCCFAKREESHVPLTAT